MLRSVVLVTDHTEFDYQRIRDLSMALVDARNAFSGVDGVVDAGRWVIKGERVRRSLGFCRGGIPARRPPHY